MRELTTVTSTNLVYLAGWRPCQAVDTCGVVHPSALHDCRPCTALPNVDCTSAVSGAEQLTVRRVGQCSDLSNDETYARQVQKNSNNEKVTESAGIYRAEVSSDDSSLAQGVALNRVDVNLIVSASHSNLLVA